MGAVGFPGRFWWCLGGHCQYVGVLSGPIDCLDLVLSWIVQRVFGQALIIITDQLWPGLFGRALQIQRVVM